MTRPATREELLDAARTGDTAADLVAMMQLNSGMSPDLVDDSAERVLADRYDNPSPLSAAFYDAYDRTAGAIADDMRDQEADDADTLARIRGELDCEAG